MILIGAGAIAVIRPGILCSFASLGTGFLVDSVVCQPAFSVYVSEV